MEYVGIAEMCPHCDYENYFSDWDSSKGYVVTCQNCGKKMMLCGMCGHWDDEKDCWIEDICDQHIKGNTASCHLGKHKL